MSRRHRTLGLALGALLASGGAWAEAEWETLATTPFVIKSRPREGTRVKEVWAEGVLQAAVADIQAAVMDADRFAEFMPYVKESRVFGQPTADGSRYVYTRLDFSAMATSRDYALKVRLLRGVDEAGQGAFENTWVAVPDHIPKRRNSVRVRVNEGSWKVTPTAEGHSHAVYRFVVDPGGWVPAFAASMGNKSAVIDTLRAVEKEAQRRASDGRGRRPGEALGGVLGPAQHPPGQD
jgi:hypothetical protein